MHTHTHPHTHMHTLTCMHTHTTHTCIHTSGLTALVAVKNLDSKAIIWNLLRLTTENLSSLPSAAIEKMRRVGISFEFFWKQDILYIKQDNMREMIRSDFALIEVQSDSVHCYRSIVCHTSHNTPTITGPYILVDNRRLWYTLGLYLVSTTLL